MFKLPQLENSRARIWGLSLAPVSLSLSMSCHNFLI